ncbi:hypothetical protein K402DRAFT_126792 [Aulographum hederae CBS 113979]|uniref:YDG domain-containing protein n=1 Tax=Aulographum hederae CBS 113979 TaxID=1176131 RepID=A0A6G1HE41_9PEZI|nr:hypothetical protein K402DRAFT_126792 [Aulographum hederae CBS 113979]
MGLLPGISSTFTFLTNLLPLSSLLFHLIAWKMADDPIDLEGVTSVEEGALVWPTSPALLEEAMRDFTKRVVALLYLKTKPGRGRSQIHPELILRFRMGMNGIFDVRMTPALNKATNVNKMLEFAYDVYLRLDDEDMAAKVDSIHEQWKAENWGAEEEEEEEVEASTEERTAPRNTSYNSGPTRLSMARRPHPNHPIFGTNGIMYGTLYHHGPTFDPQLRSLHRNSKVYGHNGMNVGDWFPYRHRAIFMGAHGHYVGGITAGPSGAYSIVAAANTTYDDRDTGNTLFYCGSGSDTNTENTVKDTMGTKALQKSRITGREVRVLRSGGKHFGVHPKPECGIRYDGLYTVATQLLKTNDLGGAYLEFELRRLVNQAPLDYTHPTARECQLYDLISSGY